MVKLAMATVIIPMEPRRSTLEAGRIPRVPDPANATADASPADPVHDNTPHPRATITDRNGEILAVSLPTAGVYANPKEMIDPDDAAAKLKSVLPTLDLETVKARLHTEKQFAWIARGITPRQQLAINNLGIPGIYFQPTERRRYPQGRVAAQVLGGGGCRCQGCGRRRAALRAAVA